MFSLGKICIDIFVKLQVSPLLQTNKQTSTTPQLISSFQQANNRVMQKDYDNNWYFLGANQENDKSSFSHFFLPFSLQNNIVNRYAKVQQPTQVTYSRQTLKSLYRYFSWQWYIQYLHLDFTEVSMEQLTYVILCLILI